MSEGGCGCMDDLECQCGSGSWDCTGHDDMPTCNICGTGPHEDGRRHSKEHRARKTYLEGRPGEIRPGDLYRRTAHFGYYPGGAFTLRVTRRRLEKGPAWDEPLPRTRYERILVDTAFINASGRLPGMDIKHMGFGEFTLITPKGEVEFDRMRGKDFEGQSGRSHQFYSQKDPRLAMEIIKMMEAKGKSEKMASAYTYDRR
jgi:hypothetical protein